MTEDKNPEEPGELGPAPSEFQGDIYSTPNDQSDSDQKGYDDIDPTPAAKPLEDLDVKPSVANRAERSAMHGTQWFAVESDGVSAWQRFWGFLTGPAVIAVFFLAFGIIGFFVTTRIVELWKTISTLATWQAWCAVTLLGICILAILASTGYLMIIYFRLKRNHQIHLDELSELGRRSSLQRQEAMESLISYLTDYPIEDASFKLPMDNAKRNELLEAKQNLLGQWQSRLRQMPDEWVKRFVEMFQNLLDKEADGRVQQAARMVAFKTAVSPNPLVDTAIVLFWSFKILGDLCRLYNLRVGTFETLALLSRVFFAAYIAGQLDEWEEHAKESFEGMLEGMLGADVLKSIVARVGAKTGAGLANYFLMRRIGKKAIEMLRPIRS